MRDRIDKILVLKGLVTTRARAQALIKDGAVEVDGNKVKKSSELYDSESEVVLLKELDYVGRGGQKLAEALKRFGISTKGLVVADIGASTGGFTDCVLQLGALKVYAIDVGHGQMSVALLSDDRVINMEGVNIRELDGLPELVDLCVVDLSFISVKLVLKNIVSLLKESGEVVVLVKPQFEVGKDGISKHGVVKSDELRLQAVCGVHDWCVDYGIVVCGAIISPIRGKCGNQEYLFHLKCGATGVGFSREEIKNL